MCRQMTGKLDKDEAVDLILGNNQKKQIVEVLEEYERQHKKQKHVIKINQTKEYEELEMQSYSRACACLYQSTGWMQSVLYLLYHSLCQRQGAQP